MSIVKDFTIPFSKGNNRVRLGIPENCMENRVSVIIGENGTRKSYLLRRILDAALPTISQVSQPQLPIEEEVCFVTPPNKVIAISAVPHDRFPSKSDLGDNNRMSRYDNDSYSYIGPRTFRNIISRNQSVRELILNILKDPRALSARSPFLSSVVNEIGIGATFSFGLNPRPHASWSRTGPQDPAAGSYQTFSDFIKLGTDKTTPHDKARYVRWPEQDASLLFHSLMNPEGQQLVESIDNSVKNHILRKSSSRRDEVNSAVFKVEAFLADGALHTGGVPPEALYWALRFGYLRPTRMVFSRNNGDLITQEEFSAGQWSFFSTLASLSLSVQEPTLILIDEPESCLHPSWQRTYIDHVLRAIVHAKGCHVILATHAPLILSSLPTSGDCIILQKDEEQNDVFGSHFPTPSGWDSSSILEEIFSIKSARGPILTELMNESLGLIAKGVEANKKSIQDKALDLMPFLDRLPEDDLARDVINTIFNIAFAEK